MKSNSAPAALIAIAALTAVSCSKVGQTSSDTGGGAGSGSGSCTTSSSAALSAPTIGGSVPAMTGNNVLNITVNGGGTCSNSYPNKPCVSVKVCNTTNTYCNTINDILLDTGSVGLRVFKSVLDPTLQNDLYGTNPTVVECAQFGDGSLDWGPVVNTYVGLGGEAAVQVPVQIIDSTWGATAQSSCPAGFSACNVPNIRAAYQACGTADTPPDHDPTQAGFNGILGVGLFVHDCLDGSEGATCAAPYSGGGGQYYTCTSSSSSGACSNTSVANVNEEVQNPVALLPVDNNGVIIQLPTIASTGAASAAGYMVLGIQTETNNVPEGVTPFATNNVGEYVTDLAGNAMISFLDTGSNALYLPEAVTGFSECNDGEGDYWFCPAATTSCSAVNFNADQTASSAVDFLVGDSAALFTTGNSVFNDLASDSGGAEFDWGLPFFMGRNVYLGINGVGRSSLGTGPYWAY